MKKIFRIFFTILIIIPFSFSSNAQESKVVITGVRFSYPLVNAWIDTYKASHPNANIQIESRTTTDPAKYDLLIEAYEPDSLQKETRDFVYIGRYALLPVANANSAFAKDYGARGLTEDLIRQAYFTNPYADKERGKKIEINYTVYTRLQKAGAPITLAKYFGFEQSNIKGKAIAGADEHLIKAVLKDSSAISYATLGLIYDLKTRTPISGLTILPVDLDDNGRVNDEERIYGNIDQVITRFEAGNLENVPVEYLHISISKKHSNPEALKFLQWILNNGQDNLNEFGFLKPEPKRFQKEKEKLLKQLTLN
jgi:ABC-type phosphate transport system substrate-binding protein